MRDNEFLRAIQSRAARVAITASTVRGRGNKGVVGASRAFLRALDLRKFGRRGDAQFCRSLNVSTATLCAALPRGARHWGLARKVLNIFLRDCLYTAYLRDAFSLGRNETLFELPLDSITWKQLARVTGHGRLPRWRGVKHLTQATSSEFQEAAARAAARLGVARVHLDAFWWSVTRDGE